MENKKRLADLDVLTDTIEGIDWYHISLRGTLSKGANSQIHTPLYKADDIYKALKETPAVDAVEVVRCKDCKYKFKANGHNKKGCPLDGAGLMNDDDFCSCGERKSVDD